MTAARTRTQPFRSFRSRLTLFFVGIVIIPLVVVAIVLFGLVGRSESGKTDARLAQSERAAVSLYDQKRGEAADAAQRIAADPALSSAIRADQRLAIQRRLVTLAGTVGAAKVQVTLGATPPIEVGAEEDPVAPAANDLNDQAGQTVGRIVVSTIGAVPYLDQVSTFTAAEAVIAERGRLVAATLPDVPTTVELPDRGEVDVAGTEYRAAGFEAPAFDGGRLDVTLLARKSSPAVAGTTTTLLVAGALVGFLALAFAFALTVSRSLQDEIQELLNAAQQLGRGDFDVKVPAEGNDEFAALGREFNSMAAELKARLEDLQRERTRLQDAIRRVGDSLTSGLDRTALLEIVLETAVDGVGADGGRARVRDRVGGGLDEVAKVGHAAALGRALHAAETAVLDAGQGAAIQVAGVSAIAQPLRTADGGDRVLGLISVARNGQPFDKADRDLLSYLAGQTGISIENVGLHETVQRQAVTDELTGLFNHRRFQEVISTEVERTKRFGSDMGLIMLDIDNFKRVNDTYGHMQGDLVLREVARVLRESSREVDEPARYGGEEMAVALPQTDLDGAFQFAERVREKIEALDLPILDGGGTLNVTASFGAAALTRIETADKDALVAAADAALYRAKRAGKNRTVKAE